MNPDNPMTPGVYTRELNAFPNSVPMVPTAVPAFIGYTLRTSSPKGEDLLNKARFISSLREFTDLYGQGPWPVKFEVKGNPNQDNSGTAQPGQPNQGSDTKTPAPQTSPTLRSAQVTLSDKKPYTVTLSSRFYLYDAMRMYFANGGGPCYVISVGKASDGTTPPQAQLWSDEIGTILEEIPFPKPTIICIPDAVLLSNADRFDLYNKALKHCTQLFDRVVLMDVPTEKGEPKSKSAVGEFRDGVVGDKPSYGIAYYPELITNLYGQDDFVPSNIDANSLQKTTDGKSIWDKLKDPGPPKPNPNAAAPSPSQSDGTNEEAKKPQTDAQLHASLLATDPSTPANNGIASDYKSLLSAMMSLANVMPPSAAMAGIYARVDSDQGVWRAPANTNILGVVAPTVNVTDETQASLNVDANAGKSINAIRSFYGRGPAIVWGARTLDGNSKDWRYINVRRTVILIEQSVANAAFSMVFEPNTAPTWTTCRAMIAGFLRTLWAAGALQGATPEDAFSVTVGLGTTMTADDILDGIMRIEVKLALVRPAEFIIITYQQQMAKS